MRRDDRFELHAEDALLMSVSSSCGVALMESRREIEKSGVVARELPVEEAAVVVAARTLATSKV